LSNEKGKKTKSKIIIIIIKIVYLQVLELKPYIQVKYI